MQPINAACRGQPAATPAHDPVLLQREQRVIGAHRQERGHENIRTLENYFREFSFFFGYRDCYRVFYRVPADGALLTKPAELLLF